jgi:hypothetical protein
MQYVRPVPTLYYEDYDENWVQNGKGKKGTEEYHQSTPVTDLQKNLKKVGVFQNGFDDGHFFDKTKVELMRFQEAASKGVFSQADNTRVVLDNKLAGFKKGTACPNTIDFLNMIVGRGLKVPCDNDLFACKGDKSEIVEEINIRLSGFGGGVPKVEFDDETEMKVKNFERLYMKRENPTGVVDTEVIKAIEEFGKKYALNSIQFLKLKCTCIENCGGFGKKRHKGDYFEKKDKNGHSVVLHEGLYRYEYPGIHRALLWAVCGIGCQLVNDDEHKIRFMVFSSGYRCNDDSTAKKNYTTNHMGKAVDIHYGLLINGNTIRPTDNNERQKLCEQVRTICQKKNVLNAQLGWNDDDRFSMESAADGATTWVHIDVRKFNKDYLHDIFFCNTLSTFLGKPLTTFSKG